jgi:hypothetical protein
MDIFGKKRIRSLRQELEKANERIETLQWYVNADFERRIRALEMHTDLVPMAPGVGTWKKEEMPE